MSETVVYGTSPDSSTPGDSQSVMTEKVQQYAGSIYKEFERMIARYDEEVVKNLMPLVVNVLECLDISTMENQEHEVELELLREDNEQLATQYERERQLRKSAEEKLLRIEDAADEEKRGLQAKVQSMESIMKMFEIKQRNSADQVARFEEKEQETKMEYSKLHSRYTDLLRTHMDYMERTRMMLGTDRLDMLQSSLGRGKSPVNPPVGIPLPGGGLMNRSSGPVSYGFESLQPMSTQSPSALEGNVIFDRKGGSLGKSLEKEMSDATTGPRSPSKTSQQQTSTTEGQEDGVWDHPPPATDTVSSQARYGGVEEVDENPVPAKKSLYHELQFQDSANDDDITDGDLFAVDWSDFDGGDFFGRNSNAKPTVVTEESDDPPDRNILGMGKEVESLIQENNELLATKNALNIVKDDLIAKVDELTSDQELLREQISSLTAMKERLQERTKELEEDLRKTKEELEAVKKQHEEEESKYFVRYLQDTTPMADRKRFTRVEMARVLSERNDLKQKLFDLQEAVKWAESIRAQRMAQEQTSPKKQGIWKIFSTLFTSQDRNNGVLSPTSPTGFPPTPMGIRYVGGGRPEHVTPALETMRRRGLTHGRGSARENEEKQAARRALERREHYKTVRAYVEKDDGRTQAYGWSLPAPAAQQSTSTPTESPTQPSPVSPRTTPVPVPVYCRPLMEKDTDMRICCAAGVDLSGGRTKDGGSIVGASVFYHDVQKPRRGSNEKKESPEVIDAVEALDEELREHEEQRRECEQRAASLSSLVWIGVTSRSASRVLVIDANNPADILQTFPVCNSFLLCMASVPETDDPGRAQEASSKSVPSPRIGNIHFVSCATSETGPPSLPHSTSPTLEPGEPNAQGSSREEDLSSPPTLRRLAAEKVSDPLPSEEPVVASAPASGPASTSSSSSTATSQRRILREPEGIVKDGLSELPKESPAVVEAVSNVTSVLPTMWLGAKSGAIYIHSAVTDWKKCIHSVKMRDAVLAIVHIRGRVLVALADNSIALFRRDSEGQWSLDSYHLLVMPPNSPVLRTMNLVGGDRVWAAFGNKIHVINPLSLDVEHTFDAHPRRESQVRQLAWIGDGVWVSIRLDSTLRLFHAHTRQHLQDVDVEPYVSKMLGTGKLGFSFVRITSLLIASSRLWIGTGNGVILSVPLSESPPPSHPSSSSRLPGNVVRVYADPDQPDRVTPGSFIPFCNMSQTQLSFHGHQDAVKFFVAVPERHRVAINPCIFFISSIDLGVGSLTNPAAVTRTPEDQTSPSRSGSGTTARGSEGTSSTHSSPSTMLILSGGEGYIDFRIAEELEETILAADIASHLIVWQLDHNPSLSLLPPPPPSPLSSSIPSSSIDNNNHLLHPSDSTCHKTDPEDSHEQDSHCPSSAAVHQSLESKKSEDFPSQSSLSSTAHSVVSCPVVLPSSESPPPDEIPSVDNAST
ncbi:unnamed protein product [Cyprideis torosa]|uniref:JNK-interacting protein 3 n=1 Tax=Cyprideis torosa TaxID=163714 RepID=A0A7R8ZJP0_9CRUS|nr:unnamed protein product [Cyprideis torosa]CAG0887550.1 unnamed protein product [Cyprideis torosa]